MRDQRRSDELEPDEVRIEVGHGERGELGAHEPDLLGRRAEAAVLLGHDGATSAGAFQRRRYARPAAKSS